MGFQEAIKRDLEFKVELSELYEDFSIRERDLTC